MLSEQGAAGIIFCICVLKQRICNGLDAFSKRGGLAYVLYIREAGSNNDRIIFTQSE